MLLCIGLTKKQNSVEKNTFSSKFIEMKCCTGYIIGLRFRLRMIGIPCEDPAFVCGDHISLLCNTPIPDSALNKMRNSITFHFVREGSAMD